LYLFLIIEKNLTVSTKMPQKYSISTLKYPKNFWGGGSAPSLGRGHPLRTPHPPQHLASGTFGARPGPPTATPGSAYVPVKGCMCQTVKWDYFCGTGTNQAVSMFFLRAPTNHIGIS